MISSTAWACLVLSPAMLTRSAVLRCVVESLGTVVVLVEWSITLTLHYSHIVAVCLHGLQALTVLPVCTSCSPMMP
jgi:hypothetical protein